MKQIFGGFPHIRHCRASTLPTENLWPWHWPIRNVPLSSRQSIVSGGTCRKHSNATMSRLSFYALTICNVYKLLIRESVKEGLGGEPESFLRRIRDLQAETPGEIRRDESG